MNNQEVKEYLNRAYYLDRRIDTLQDELNMLENRLYKCTPSYNSNVGNSPQPTFEYVLDRVIQYRERLNREVDNLIDAKNDIKSCIDSLSDGMEKIVLTKRYINYQKYEDIANDLHYSTMQIHRIHNHALNNLKMLLNVSPKV